MKNTKDIIPLSVHEIQTLQARVVELEQTLNSIQSGGVDALLIKNKEGEPSVFTIEGTEQPYRKLIESMSEGAVTLSEEGEIIHCNKRFSEMVSCSTQEIIGSTFFKFFPATARNSLKQLLIKGKLQPCKQPFKLKRTKNIVKAVLLSCHKLTLGSVHGLSIVVTDITELHKAHEALKKLVQIDSLTQLPNRYLFENILTKSMGRARKNKRLLAIFYIDIDYFKNVNVLLGHGIGDTLLQEVGYRIKQSLRPEDHIVRLGGDEFAALLEDIENTTTIRFVAERLLENFARPFIISEHEIISTLSIGIAIYQSDEIASNNTLIMQQADQALYQAKQSGRNCYKYYNKTMQQKLARYVLIVNQLRTAIQENQFELLYQPKIDTKRNSIVGIEALLRLNNPSIKNITPAEFIVIAEETGLINQIGAWVMETALNQYKSWRVTCAHKMKNIKLSINISANQLDDTGMIRSVTQLLKKTNVPKDHILFELTETALLKKTLTNESLLKKYLLKLGIGISIDDFGTGYSSLTYLKQLPIKEIKIDKSFIDDIGKNENNEFIIKAIIQLARTLNLDVVAEGVETKEQLDFLTKNQCRIIQGYYFSKPLCADHMLVYINSRP
jgi:diguanylate cyclase (GGDEF)-like protein/PAS domain S-box-containing protein